MTGRADTLALQKRFTEALTAYERALVYEPLSPHILRNIATQNIQLGKVTAAQKAAQTNLKWNPNNSQALYMGARLMIEQGDYVKAHGLLLRSAKINPDDVRVQLDLSQLYAEIDMVPQAIEAARSPGPKAVIFALTGDDKSARQSIENYLKTGAAPFAYYLIEDYDASYQIVQKNIRQYNMIGKGKTGVTNILRAVEHAFVLRQKNDPNAEILLREAEVAVADLTAETARLTDSLIGGAAIKMMRNNPDGAWKYLDVAIDRGQSLLTLTERPVFAKLEKHSGYEQRRKKMIINAARDRKSIKVDMASR